MNHEAKTARARRVGRRLIVWGDPRRWPGLLMFFFCMSAAAEEVRYGGLPVQLDLRAAGERGLRITLKPVAYSAEAPSSPAVVEGPRPDPVLRLREVEAPVRRRVGDLQVEVRPHPLTVAVSVRGGRDIQRLVFEEDGAVSFRLDDRPVLGLGGGGSRPEKGTDWRQQPVEYDRRGRYDEMLPRWQADAYGSRNPAPVLVAPGSWAMFVASPWVAVDLREKTHGVFVPWKPAPEDFAPQAAKEQKVPRSKGRPPAETQVPGIFDVFMFDAANPADFFRDFSSITGPAALPPKWALGYMQSHRTLEDDRQMIAIVDEFRRRRIPLDAVIYLGTGFVPRGWNKPQPSFEFNPQVFTRNPAEVIADLHDRHVNVVLHMVPWDRDRLPGLRGNIPPLPGEPVDASHILTYWEQHLPLERAGVDAFWPDEGDWLNLPERMKRHQMYYQGPLSADPDRRPWSLLRNGYPGIARWGGWIWSGDTESSWKSLEAQIAVGLNFAVSIGPFWGTDIGGFFSNEELTGELYARWFQFGAFCPSFRAHGTTWKLRLPWGWGLSDMAPIERAPPLASEMNNPAIEPVVKSYAELRYRLLPYTYTLAWEARRAGLPLMRPMWVHYPGDEACRRLGNQYLWGRDLLLAPVYEKGATARELYLPEGAWYDWWTGARETGGRTVRRKVDLSIMPIYVRAGAILPLDPVRQYTAESTSEPTTLRIYPGADGQFTLYEDDGISQAYLAGKARGVDLSWSDRARRLTLRAASGEGLAPTASPRTFRVELMPGGGTQMVVFGGKSLEVRF